MNKISRRSFLKNSTLGLSFLAASSLHFGMQGCTKKEPDPRPNFLIFLADDLGWGDVGFHQSEIQTPNLNKIGDFGVYFSRFYVYPTCSPTRASLLTGKPPSRFGIFNPIGGRSTHALPPETMTLPRLLKENGYQTAITGKWHLGLRPEVGPNQYGFEYSYGYLHGQIDQFSHEYKNGDRSWHENGKFIDEKGHATDLIAKKAIDFIKSDRDKSRPFFLYVPFSVPHYPLQEEEKWVAPYRQTIKHKDRQMYAASVTHMDDAIGQILLALRDEEIHTNTLVLFLSDNGGQKDWYPNDEYNRRHKANEVLGNNKPLRGWKGDLYEGGIRVPALALWFSKLSRDTVREPLHIMDIYPTLAHLAGATVKPEFNVEGKNLWPTITEHIPAEPRVLYWRTNREMAVRKGDWKLINKGESPETGENELYNLHQDPLETIDFSLDHPAVVAELLGELKKQYEKDTNQDS